MLCNWSSLIKQLVKHFWGQHQKEGYNKDVNTDTDSDNDMELEMMTMEQLISVLRV